jgi:uncharacterized phage infection (PIP) family protein YhgE
MPVSLEELKEELYEKLEGVYTEIDNLEAVEGFSLQSVGINVNLAQVSQSIDKLSNDEEFEELKHLLHGCFERNHRWIGNKLVEFKGQLEQTMEPVKNGLQNFERSVSLKLLDKKIEGQAIWIMDLANVQANLKQNFSEVKTEWSKVERGIDSIRNKSDQLLGDKVEIAKSGAEKLYDFQGLIKEKRTECEDVRTKLNILGGYVEAYRHWWELITLSDNVASTALSIKTSLGESKFVTDFAGISEAIKGHLQRRNKDALPNYESFTLSLESLMSKCREFTKGLREAFNAERDALNKLLADVGATVSGLRTTFNTDEPQASYDELYREAVDELKQAVEQLTDDFRNLTNELNYSANILGKTVEVGENNLLLQTKHATTEATNLLTSDLLEFVSAIRTNPDGLLPLKESITTLREVYREVKKHHRAILQPEEPTTNESKLLEVLERNEKDLKEVILQYAESSEGELNLDVVLDCLKGLFVKNQIMMRVRRI